MYQDQALEAIQHLKVLETNQVVGEYPAFDQCFDVLNDRYELDKLGDHLSELKYGHRLKVANRITLEMQRKLATSRAYSNLVCNLGYLVFFTQEKYPLLSHNLAVLHVAMRNNPFGSK